MRAFHLSHLNAKDVFFVERQHGFLVQRSNNKSAALVLGRVDLFISIDARRQSSKSRVRLARGTRERAAKFQKSERASSSIFSLVLTLFVLSIFSSDEENVCVVVVVVRVRRARSRR